MPIGTCGLCRSAGVELRDSHLLPKWCYKRVRADSTGSNPNPVRIAGGVAISTSEQLRRPFLCVSCEQRFSRWEDYVARISYQADGTFPALTSVNLPTDATETIRVVPSTGLDYEKLFQFALSIVWRADAMWTPMPRKFEQKVTDLGERYREAARQYLLGAQSHPDGIHAMMILLIEQQGFVTLSRSFSIPTAEKTFGCYVHAFAVCGLEFWVAVGQRAESILRDACLLCSANHELALFPQRQSITVRRMIRGISLAKSKIKRV